MTAMTTAKRPLWRQRLVVRVLTPLIGIGTVLLLWKVPQWQAADVIPSPDDPNARLLIENELRRTMATVIAGAFVLLTGFLSWRNVTISQQGLVVNQEGQITERFTRAIEQLGATRDDGRTHLEVRLGGIYALERIARDSPRDYGPIMEVLTAYVRENAPAPAEADASTESPEEDHRGAVDIQAILTVIARRTADQLKLPPRQLDLSRSDLKGTDLRSAHLEGAILFGTRLEWSDLVEAHLEATNLAQARLAGAHLREAYLTAAILTGAHLEGTILWGAELQGALLQGANLEGAVLTGAHLEGADLFGATGLTQQQLDDTYMDEETVLPVGLGSDGQPFRHSARKEVWV